jgi:hypothetical protein
MRQAIVGLLVALFGLLVLPVGKYFVTPAPDLLMRIAALGVLIAGWLIIGLSPTVYPWIRNPSQHAVLSTLFATITVGSIAGLSWLLFAVKIASPDLPDFTASVFAASYDPSTHTFSADVLYTNDSPIQRTIVGGTFIFHKRGGGGRAMLSPPGRNTMLGDTQYLTVDPGKTAVGHYHEALALTYVRDFNAIALTPSGELSGESETGLQFISLTPDGTRQSKDVFFMSVHVDEGVCELLMFQPKKFSLDATGDIFIN